MPASFDFDADISPGVHVGYSRSRRQAEAVIGLICACLDGMELTRIQIKNRADQATRSVPDSDGIMRGLGLAEDSPLASLLTGTADDMRAIEENLTRQLVRIMKTHPLAPWIESRRGLGLKTTGRLIGSIGDPYLRSIVADDGTWTQAPRSVYQLYAYCGMHVREDGVAPYRQKGARANWNDTARKRLYNIAVAQRYSKLNYYRPVYDKAKARAVFDVHDIPCPRCGPTGKPAAAGSSLGGAHAEGRALRAVSKQVLLDLWRHSRFLHGVEGDEDGHGDIWGPGFGDRVLARAHGLELPVLGPEPEPETVIDVAEWVAIG
jgi:hypothetical protein